MSTQTNLAVCCLILLGCILQLTGFFTRQWAYNDICVESNTFFMRCYSNGALRGIYSINTLYWATFWLETIATINIIGGFLATSFACYKDNTKALLKGMGTASFGGMCSLIGCVVVFSLHSEFSFGYSLYLCLSVGPITAGPWILYFCTRGRNSEPSAGPRQEHTANTAC